MRPALFGLAVASFAIGGALTGPVQSQTSAPAYSIVEVDVTDPAGFQAFAQKNAAGVAAAGGRFIVRRGRIVNVEGAAPKNVFVITWDSLDAATAYFESATFKDLIPARDKSSKVRLFHVEGLPK